MSYDMSNLFAIIMSAYLSEIPAMKTDTFIHDNDRMTHMDAHCKHTQIYCLDM